MYKCVRQSIDVLARLADATGTPLEDWNSVMAASDDMAAVDFDPAAFAESTEATEAMDRTLDGSRWQQSYRDKPGYGWNCGRGEYGQ